MTSSSYELKLAFDNFLILCSSFGLCLNSKAQGTLRPPWGRPCEYPLPPDTVQNIESRIVNIASIAFMANDR